MQVPLHVVHGLEWSRCGDSSGYRPGAGRPLWSMREAIGFLPVCSVRVYCSEFVIVEVDMPLACTPSPWWDQRRRSEQENTGKKKSGSRYQTAMSGVWVGVRHYVK